MELDGKKSLRSGRFAGVEGLKIQKWTVPRAQTGRSFNINVDGPMWTVKRGGSIEIGAPVVAREPC